MAMKATKVDRAHSMKGTRKANLGKVENAGIVGAGNLTAEEHIGNSSDRVAVVHMQERKRTNLILVAS